MQEEHRDILEGERGEARREHLEDAQGHARQVHLPLAQVRVPHLTNKHINQ